MCLKCKKSGKDKKKGKKKLKKCYMASNGTQLAHNEGVIITSHYRKINKLGKDKMCYNILKLKRLKSKI